MGNEMLATSQVNQLPADPGIYKYYNKDAELIYVGKAKNIKKRVASYFNKSNQHNRKTLKLVSEIDKIDYAIAHSEFDALLLENNLIKQNQPKYNILLKDDKSFPYICILNERFPRVISTRRVDHSKGTYFGPYSSVVAMNNVLDLLRKLYTIRTCKYNLSEKNITSGKFKTCLEYHIGNCKGPCEGLQSEEDYNEDIIQAKHILNSNSSFTKRYFKEKMNEHAQATEFELAQRYKDKLDLLSKFQAKTMVVDSKESNLDIFTIISDESQAYVNYLRINHGMLNFTNTTEIKKKLNEEDTHLLAQYAFDIRKQVGSASNTILSNIPITSLPEDIKNIVPRIGEKKKLIEMSIKNVLHFKKDRLLQKEKLADRNNEVVHILQQDLKLLSSPNHIECFDNSNIQGTNPVAAMVCFKNGKPAKKEYRHYNIKTVVGPDDFASMYEVVKRRYSRLIEENKPLPQLILIDGGKGQLSSAVSALKDIDIYGKISIIGIAKRLEEIYFPGDQYPLHISKKSPSLKLLQHLRDEAHRFAINFHRQKRSLNSFTTELEEIPYIGTKTADLLLKKYKSVDKIKALDQEELATIIGNKKAELVWNFFKKKGTLK
jgi:excinuclease ABC subunit C